MKHKVVIMVNIQIMVCWDVVSCGLADIKIMSNQSTYSRPNSTVSSHTGQCPLVTLHLCRMLCSGTGGGIYPCVVPSGGTCHLHLQVQIRWPATCCHAVILLALSEPFVYKI